MFTEGVPPVGTDRLRLCINDGDETTSVELVVLALLFDESLFLCFLEALHEVVHTCRNRKFAA
jgi:hypothetical protein